MLSSVNSYAKVAPCLIYPPIHGLVVRVRCRRSATRTPLSISFPGHYFGGLDILFDRSTLLTSSPLP
jgi:hypothetical protein